MKFFYKHLKLTILTLSLLLLFLLYGEFWNIKKTFPFISVHNQNINKNTIEMYDLNNELDALKRANYIFLYRNDTGNLVFKLLCDEKDSLKIHPLLDNPDSSSLTLPNFNYTTRDSIIGLYNNMAKYLTLNFDNSHFILFSYEDEHYIFNNINDKSLNSQLKDIPIDNILVTFLESESNDTNTERIGAGLLFTGGRIVDIEWSKNNNEPIKIVDEKGKPISILEGKVCWILADNSLKIDFK
ncbi:DUF3048 C-terminal domain-containing protein [Oceanirhabdus sp. W0125-5]|uniref:DUF3048 C-terminal domain-containing protein n=1 Tax=Oceanirhabdus sp. W0125-5 TaxID=2999116 RepID=UPI0022F2B729|nr:DUF3048 C-terminal domain-containing protein [Oceanirhabdus sp. W0125-5]WBW98031.1 DUF3048 C-terminal domain-containing protein [Oceanirhabdus sp. W0125-5]